MRPRQRLLRWSAVVVDIALINIAFVLAYYIRYRYQWFWQSDPVSDNPLSAYWPFELLLTGVLLFAFRADGVYEARRGQSWLDEMYRIGNGLTTAIFILWAITFATRPLVYSRLMFGYAAILIAAFLGAARIARRLAEDRLRARGLYLDQTLIVGAGEVGRAVMRTIVARPELGYRVVGFMDDDPAKSSTAIGPFKALGGLENFERILRGEQVAEVIITLPWTAQQKILDLVRACERLGVRARVVPDLFQLSLSRVDIDDLGGIPLIGIKEATISPWGRRAKRALDLAIALFGLIPAALIGIAIAIAVKLESPGPILFRQKRIGMGGKPFSITKFRSMKAGAEEAQAALAAHNEATAPLFKIRDDPRLTRLGGFLRKSSLDELPQLINVLRGEMSLVGPRPNLPSEVEQYQPWQVQRLEVPPGITGLWQVSGRSDLSFDEMCLLDIYYIENWSLKLDLMILLRTVPRVLWGNGAY
ncbi:MAG: sugar transferase [Chloroflexi bacterium]|nr:sugar transferase [Chloroflexota bacterium]